MDTTPSSSALPLVWILELLARSKQLPLSVLIDLSNNIPKADDRIFTNLRELVSLRILESIHKPPSGSIAIDPSHSCVNILQRLFKNSAPNVKFAAAKMSKWDIQPFLDHKRSSFPDSFLVKIKDAILNGNLASLREQSGLPPLHVTLAPNMVSQNDHLVSAKSTDQLPAAKSRIRAPSAIVEKRPSKDPVMQDGNVEAIMKPAKKRKPDTIYTEKQIPNSILETPLNKSNVESSQKCIAANPNSYREGFSAVEMTDKNERMRQEQDCDDQGQHEHAQTADVNMDELDQDIQINVPNAEEAEKRDSCIARDSHNDEMANVAKNKEAFLSSQDSLADSFSELMLCVKCNKGENVLVCSNSCALAIHESCMISGASFDKDGKFYCPFCAYSRALSEYKEVKKKVSAARNDLSNFISTESRKETEKQPTSSNHLKQVDGLPKRTDSKSKAVCIEKLDCVKAGPSEGGLPNNGKEVGSTRGKTCTESKDKRVNKRTRQVTHSPRGVRQRQTSEQASLKSQNEKALHETSEGSDELVEIRPKKGVSCPTETDSHCEHKSSPSTDTASEEEISEFSSDNSYNPEDSEDDVRVLNNPECLLLAQKRRQPWTREEESKLKEAMKVICAEKYTTIPWTKILEYGAGTFHECRTSMHLKDKWRNMCKATNKQHK